MSRLVFTSMLLFCSVLLCSGQTIAEKPPAEWTVALREYGTTAQPGSYLCRIFVSTSGLTPGYISAQIPEREEFRKQLSAAEMASIYDAARRAIASQEIGPTPPTRVRDGASLAITLSSSDRSIEVAVHNSGILSASTHEFVTRINDLLPDDYRVRWETRSNQAMQRTAGRAAFYRVMTFTLHPQPYATSPALADLVSR